MLAAVLGQPWRRDIPVCLPGRPCVDQAPVAAPLIEATSALTPLSPLIAGGCFAAVGVALVLVVVLVRRQWRGRGASPWLVLLVTVLLLVGACTWWVVSSRLAVIEAIYSGTYGQAAVTVPPSLVGSWPAVLTAGYAMLALGGLAPIAVVGTALRRRRTVDIRA